jgi:hypothetical protein
VTLFHIMRVQNLFLELACSLSNPNFYLSWSPKEDFKLVSGCRFLRESGSAHMDGDIVAVSKALDVLREETAKGILQQPPERLIKDGFDPLWVALSRDIGKWKFEQERDRSGASGETINKLPLRACQRALDDYWGASDLHGSQVAADPDCTDVGHDSPKDTVGRPTIAKEDLYTCATALLSLKQDLNGRPLSGTMEGMSFRAPRRSHERPTDA